MKLGRMMSANFVYLKSCTLVFGLEDPEEHYTKISKAQAAELILRDCGTSFEELNRVEGQTKEQFLKLFTGEVSDVVMTAPSTPSPCCSKAMYFDYIKKICNHTAMYKELQATADGIVRDLATSKIHHDFLAMRENLMFFNINAFHAAKVMIDKGFSLFLIENNEWCFKKKCTSNEELLMYLSSLTNPHKV